LRHVFYPHGLRFSSDGRAIFVADAGAPYVHVYATDDQGWRGVHHPVATVRIMDESLFLRGRHGPEEGGPKGIDIDAGLNVLVATSEYQPLAFFDVPAMLEAASTGTRVPVRESATTRSNGASDDEPFQESHREQRALEVRYELHILEQSRLRKAEAVARAEAVAVFLRNSMSWRMTAPVRRIGSALRRFR
jgi:hypothetical protein